MGAGVVLIEAWGSSGDADGSFLRPPLVLEDAAGSRLYVPVLEELSGIRALRGGTLRGPMLGDQTNGVVYRAGEAVVFVGHVNGQRAQAPTYRDGKSLGVNGFVADLAWLVYKGATRDDVVKALRQREISRIPVVVVVLLLVASLLLSLVTFIGR